MKKTSKNNEVVESYIGGNHFNIKYVEIDATTYDNN